MKSKLKTLKNKYAIKLSDKVFEYAIGVELEHGSKFGPQTNITGDNLDTTAKIVMAHLNEFPDYYQRLKRMEAEADKYWATKKRSKSRRTTKRRDTKRSRR